MTQFSIRAVADGAQCDLVLSGEVDLQVSDTLIRVAQTSLEDAGVQRLLLDLGAVTFMDSTGLGALVAIRNAATKRGKEFVLGNIPARIRQLLGITGLDSVFAISADGASGSGPSVQPSSDDGSETDAPTDPQLRIVPS